MTVPELLKELEPFSGRFPMEAMREAIAQREAIAPELLRVLEANGLIYFTSTPGAEPAAK